MDLRIKEKDEGFPYVSIIFIFFIIIIFSLLCSFRTVKKKRALWQLEHFGGSGREKGERRNKKRKWNVLEEVVGKTGKEGKRKRKRKKRRVRVWRRKKEGKKRRKKRRKYGRKKESKEIREK